MEQTAELLHTSQATPETSLDLSAQSLRHSIHSCQVCAKKAILNVARMGKFSSDRTIREYARGIWNVTPVPSE